MGKCKSYSRKEAKAITTKVPGEHIKRSEVRRIKCKLGFGESDGSRHVVQE